MKIRLSPFFAPNKRRPDNAAPFIAHNKWGPHIFLAVNGGLHFMQNITKKYVGKK